MFSSTNHIGISITENALQLVEVVKHSDKYYLENADSEYFEEKLHLLKGKSKIIPTLQKSFNAITSRKALQSKFCSITLPVNICKMFVFPYEEALSKNELNNHIAWEFSVLFPTEKADQYVMRSIQLFNYDNPIKKMVCVAIKRDLLETIHEFAKNNNLILRFVDNGHFASNALLNIKSSKKNIMSIFINDNYCSIISYINGKIHSFKNYEFAHINYLLDIIDNYSEAQNTVYDNIFMNSMNDIDNFKIIIGSKLNKEIETTDPFKNITLSESFVPNDNFLKDKYSFTAAAGICFRLF